MIVAAVIVMANGSPPSRRGMKMSPGGFLLMLLFCNGVVFAIVFAVLTFIKKRTIVCDPEGCSISGIDYWGTKAPDESFRWNELTDTNLVSTYVGKGGHQLSVEVNVHEKRYRLMSRQWLKAMDFDDMLDVINTSATHLGHELIKAPAPPDAHVMDEVLGYCKVKRNVA